MDTPLTIALISLPAAWFPVGTIATLVLCLILLATTRIPPEIVLFAATLGLMAIGVLSPAQTLIGFASPGLMTVACMFIVAAGLHHTGTLARLLGPVLGHPKTLTGALLRLILPVAIMSAFLNNTPIVAVMLPIVLAWSRTIGQSPSQLLIPLSFATILGGTCTLIGTSTNLLIADLLAQSVEPAGQPPLALFDLAWVGLPLALAGIAYILIAAPRLLPARLPAMAGAHSSEQFLTELVVEPESALVGQTIAQAGLRNLRQAYLAEILRSGELLTAVAPDTVLHAGDRLVFCGRADRVLSLEQRPGLRRCDAGQSAADAHARAGRLLQVLVRPGCAAVGNSIRNSRFRTRYGAAVLAVARSDRRLGLQSGLGEVVLQPGDLLLLEAGAQFRERYADGSEFTFLDLPAVLDRPPWPASLKALAALTAVVAFAASTGQMLPAAMFGALAMLALGCLTARQAREALDLPVLIVIAFSIALGTAMQTSGAADLLAGWIRNAAGTSSHLALPLLYIATALCTSMITNNAAAVLMFPIAMATAGQLGHDPLPYVVAVMFAASADFATPIGYQTNLMVYGPGGYRFADYLRFGLPLQAIAFIVTCLLVPLVWPLTGPAR